MSATDKAAVTELFQALGLEGLPARVYRCHARPTRQQLLDAFNGDAHLMVRAAVATEVRNLPRIAGVTADLAADWIAKLPEAYSVIIQPYDEVVFSAELAVYDNSYVAELIPGIWELSTVTMPAVIEFAVQGSSYSLAWVTNEQTALFHDAVGGYQNRPAVVSDWHVATVVDWVQAHDGALRSLTPNPSIPFGIKLHYAAKYGLSPQNIRTTVPKITTRPDDSPEDLVRIARADAPIARGAPVLLDVAIARESYAELDKLIERMTAAGLPTVYLKSGLLSHLAIGLREAGLVVKRYNG